MWVVQLAPWQPSAPLGPGPPAKDPLDRPLFDREALIESIEAGLKPGWLFFWSHQGGPLPEPGPACLSQWYPAPFEIGGQHYGSTEHYMMAEKARTFGDAPARRRILTTAEPSEAKRLGREVAGFDSEIWAREREAIVVRGNLAKFRAGTLRAYLRSTGDAVLVEASPEDALWGIGVDENDPRAQEPHRWPGLNRLGFILMRVRADIHAAERKASAIQ